VIVTVTLNPSLDRTIELSDRLLRGQVQRAARTTQQPGGKGVNVSRALHAAGIETLAILPGSLEDPMIVALHADGIPAASVAVPGAVRANTTITEPDGTTTKLNEPGEPLSAEATDALLTLIVTHSRAASWLVLAGSLPPGVPTDFYARIVRAVRRDAGERDRATDARRAADGRLRIAVDTSGAPLAALVASGEPVDLIKPNAEELLELVQTLPDGAVPAGAAFETEPGSPTGPDVVADPEHLAAGDDRIEQLAASVLSESLGAVLVTLGANGAELVTRHAVHSADAPRIEARSTVGAGDCSLAGYLLAADAGRDDAGRLAQAIAYGAAAAALPGSTVPTPAEAPADAIAVSTRSRRTLSRPVAVR
jgi:1-phosphofructokinase